VPAPLSDAVLRLLVRRELVGAARDDHGRRRPKRERVHRGRGPRAARRAVAEAHLLRGPAEAQLDGAAETTPAILSFGRHCLLLRRLHVQPRRIGWPRTPRTGMTARPSFMTASPRRALARSGGER